MCQHCVKTPFPQRNNICLENGTYFLNFHQCVQCAKKREPKIENREVSEDEEEEVITYRHVCSECGHTIADHEYRFRVEGDFQEYEMSCLLCGHGEDSRSIMPNDPRHEQMLF